MAFKYLVISYLENIRRPRNADQTNTIPEFAYILRGRTFLVCQSSISDTANRMQTLHHGSPKYLTTASVPHEFDFCLCMWFSGPTNEALQCAIPSHSNSSSNVIYGVTARDLATDHAKSTQAPGAGMLNYPAHKLNFHSLPATTQPWAE